jgi:hypothetical protein
MFRYSFIADQLLKALTHKYVRRVPKGVTKTGATRYMYYYAGQEGHGKGVAHESELVQGASFAFGEHGKSRYHAHITKVDGDKLTIKYDDGDKKGKEETMTKKQFQALVHGEHSQAIKQAQSKAEKQLQEAKTGKERGVKFSDKTMSKLEERVKNLQGFTQKQEQVKQEEKKKPTPKKKETSADDIVKNVTKETIGHVLKSYLLDAVNKDASPRLLGINVNMESKRFEATDGYIAKLLDFPEDLKIDIIGNSYSNGEFVIPPIIIDKLAKEKNATLEFNGTTLQITLKNSNGDVVDSAKSVAKENGEYPDLQKRMLNEEFIQSDTSKNVLSLTPEAQQLLGFLGNTAGLTKDLSNPVLFVINDKKQTVIELNAFTSLPDKFRNTQFHKFDVKKLTDALINQDGIMVDSNFEESNGMRLLRNKKTKEIIGVGATRNAMLEDSDFVGMPEDALKVYKISRYDAPDAYTIQIPTNIETDISTPTKRKFSRINLGRIANSADKIIIPPSIRGLKQPPPSFFTNDKNMKGVLQPQRD